MPTHALLRKFSPLVEILLDGKVPIVSISPLPAEGDRPESYVVDASKLNWRQGVELIHLLCERWDLTKDIAINYIDEGLPLALGHFVGVESDDPGQIRRSIGDDNGGSNP